MGCFTLTIRIGSKLPSGKGILESSIFQSFNKSHDSVSRPASTNNGSLVLCNQLTQQASRRSAPRLFSGSSRSSSPSQSQRSSPVPSLPTGDFSKSSSDFSDEYALAKVDPALTRSILALWRLLTHRLDASRSATAVANSPPLLIHHRSLLRNSSPSPTSPTFSATPTALSLA